MYFMKEGFHARYLINLHCINVGNIFVIETLDASVLEYEQTVIYFHPRYSSSRPDEFPLRSHSLTF